MSARTVTSISAPYVVLGSVVTLVLVPVEAVARYGAKPYYSQRYEFDRPVRGYEGFLFPPTTTAHTNAIRGAYAAIEAAGSWVGHSNKPVNECSTAVVSSSAAMSCLAMMGNAWVSRSSYQRPPNPEQLVK